MYDPGDVEAEEGKGKGKKISHGHQADATSHLCLVENHAPTKPASGLVLHLRKWLVPSPREWSPALSDIAIPTVCTSPGA